MSESRFVLKATKSEQGERGERAERQKIERDLPEGRSETKGKNTREYIGMTGKAPFPVTFPRIRVASVL